MDRVEIKKLWEDSQSYGGKQITVYGWVKTIRDSKDIGFAEINDGSSFKGVQIVFESAKIANYKDVAKTNVGAALRVTGTSSSPPPFPRTSPPSSPAPSPRRLPSSRRLRRP